MMYFILTFFLGAAVGSFVNVLIDRTMVGEDWIWGRSHCDQCKKLLSWYDMVPIFSFAIYRGRSRCCGSPLTYRYLLVESLVGLLFLWWAVMGVWFFRLVSAPLTIVQPAFWLITGVVLLILALSDLFYGVVIMNMVWLGSAIVLIYRFTLWNYGAYNMHDFGQALLMAALFYGFFWLLYKLTGGKGMADGDMYAAMYMGLLLGYPKGLVAMALSFILGAGVGVLLIAFKLRTRKDRVPFVPFMVAAMIIALLLSEQIIGYVS